MGPCVRPRYWDDCSDMLINDETGDIDITLDQLLSKVEMSHCMMETRKNFYKWAADSHTLLALCRGDYDIFCDQKYLFENEEHACLAQINNLLDRNAADGDIINDLRDRLSDRESAHSVIGNNFDGMPMDPIY